MPMMTARQCICAKRNMAGYIGYDEPQNLLLKADSTDTMATVGKAAEEILNSNLNVTDGSDVTYKAQDLQEQAKQIQQLSQSTNMMLIWIAGISLLVGGIGVMNIMLVSSHRAYLGDRT